MAFFRFVFGVSLIAIVLTLSGAAVSLLPGGGSISRENGDSHASFYDRSLGVSFTYPEPWKKAYLSTTLINFSGDALSMMLEITQMEKDKEYTLEEYTKKNLSEIAESAVADGFTYVLESSGEAPLAGEPGYRIQALIGKEGSTARTTQLWTVHDKTVYALTFSAPLNSYEKSVQAFEDVVKSVKIRQ